jgi:hypothetical protein
VSAGALEAVARILEQGGEADDVLRAVVASLAEQPRIEYAAVVFVEEGRLVVGPQAGVPDELRRSRAQVTYEGAAVGELWADGEADPELLASVSALIASHVLVGWDTGGEGWEP